VILSISSLIQTLISYSLSVIGKFGPIGVLFLMTLEGLGIPFPSEIIMPLSGIYSSGKPIEFFEYVMAGSIGGFIGNIILYYISKFGGRPIIIGIGKYFGLRESHLESAELWFNSKGEWTVFAGRFVVGLRSFMSVPAGIAEMSIIKFSLLTFSGSIMWSGGLAYIGYIVGYNYVKLISYVNYIGIFALIIIIIYIVFILIRRNFSGGNKGRQ
jgi:Uncharacterized membrane-associated protein